MILLLVQVKNAIAFNANSSPSHIVANLSYPTACGGTNGEVGSSISNLATASSGA